MANSKKYVSFEKLGYYHEKNSKVIADGDAAALKSAKDYADSLSVNYDVAGSSATVQGKLDEEAARAKAKEEELAGSIETAQGEVDALEGIVATKADKADLEALAGKVGNVPEGSTVMSIITNIQENAYDDTELKAEINAELEKKADKTQVATDIETAVKVEEDARKEAVQGVQDAVDALSGTHATDKAALEADIASKVQTINSNIFSLGSETAIELDKLAKEDIRIVGLVEAEAERAAGVEAGLEERLVEVETFFKTAEGETIDEALDTLVELQTYLNGEGTVADQMLLDIAANKKAIEDHVATDHDFAGADAALKAELEEKINGKVAQGDFDAVEDRVEVLEGEMDTVEGAVATKAEAQALTDAVAALEGADATLAGKIEALEGKFGGAEGSVEDMIADAKQEAIDAAAADATTKADAAKDAAIAKANELNTAMDTRMSAVEAASATHALASDLTTLAGRVATSEGKITTLEGEMDAVEERVGVNEGAISIINTELAKKAAQTDLEAAIVRIKDNEDKIASFVEVSEEEINALFA